MSKVLTVFGATGNQGGSVVDAVLRDPKLSQEFAIRAATRDVNKPSAKSLSDKGVEVVSADLSSADSLVSAIKGSHTVFLVTNFWESLDDKLEIQQGKNVADACKAEGVQHLIFSSLINVSKATDGRLKHVRHFDGKAEIEEYIKQVGVPATFMLPGMFMSGVENMIKPAGESYRWAFPAGADEAKLPLFDPKSDTGKYVNIALKNFPSTVGTPIYAAGRYYTPNEVVKSFTQITGKKLEFVQVSSETFKSFLPPPVAEELLETMLLTADVGYYGGEDLKKTNELLDGKAVSWEEYVEARKDKW